MISRTRTLALLISVGVFVMSLAVEAQPTGTVPRIGLLQPGPGDPELVEAFRRGLRDLGYVDGKTPVVELRVAREPIEQAALIAELISLRVDVLVTWTTPAALAARRATSTVPIVVMTGDPTRTGLAASLARPGGNVTGIAIVVDELEVKRLQLLKEALPTVSRIAVMWNADNPVWVAVLQRLREVAPTWSVKLHELPVTESRHFEGALRSATTAGVGAILVVDDSLFGSGSSGKKLVDLTAKHRLPAMYHSSTFIDLGGLMSYSVDLADMMRRLAGHVEKILRGAKPADLPIEQPTKFAFSINRKAARELGLRVPPSLLQRADRLVD